MKKHLS